MNLSRIIRFGYEKIFFIFIFLIFLTLGADYKTQVEFRQDYLAFLFLFFLIFIRSKGSIFNAGFWTLVSFALFFHFEIIRFLWAAHLNFGHQSFPPFFSKYLSAPRFWAFLFGFFALSYGYFKKKEGVVHLFQAMTVSAFLISLNLIPAMIHPNSPGYRMPDGGVRFFYPVLYFAPWVEKYFIPIWSHPNWIGDILAFGFYPAIGLITYSFFILKDAKQNKIANPPSISYVFLLSTFALVIAATIFLIFSRGTILFLIFSFFLYLVCLLLKYRSRNLLAFVLIFFVVMIGFLTWAGNLSKAWREVQTLEYETDSSGGQPKSFSVNKEAAQRAIRIYKDHPIWGVGTKGWQEVSLKYAVHKSESYSLAKFEALCHYLHLLAEEGIGAYFYFLFLLAYFFEMARGLIKTKSRFKFLMALSLAAPVVMVLGHSAINDILQRFSSSLLLYLSMGTSLALMRPDFEQQA